MLENSFHYITFVVKLCLKGGVCMDSGKQQRKRNNYSEQLRVGEKQFRSVTEFCEESVSSAETMIKISHSLTLLKRL